jgi:phosphate acetyltransferase
MQRSHTAYTRLVDAAASSGEPLRTAVAHPCSAGALQAVAEASGAGLIHPILVGPPGRIEGAAPHSHAAAAEAVRLASAGDAALLMKGSLHTHELMHAVLDKGAGLRTERRISHCYLMDVEGYPAPLIITDAAINIAPSLLEKADIVRNAIHLAHGLGIAEPRVAILSAVETINPALQSTIDAAALCKMADRGQITGGLLDGPLAFDNAVNAEAAQDKGIISPVAGRAQILIMPNIEAGNMLAKQLTFLGGADAAGIVLGARVPIVLTSRADAVRTRLASCAVGVLLARASTREGAKASMGAIA